MFSVGSYVDLNSTEELAMDVIKLRTGKMAMVAMVGVLRVTLEQLFTKSPLAAYDLVMLSRDPGYAISYEPSIQMLLNLNLIEKVGERFVVRDDVQELVLAVTEGDGLQMKLVNPLAPPDLSEAAPEVKSPARLDDPELYATTIRIIQLVRETAKKHGMRLDGLSIESPNAYYGQTATGFIIEFYYGGPAYLLTPWGKIHFLRGYGADMEAMWAELTPLLGVTLHRAGYNSTQGEHGPWYALHALDGNPLPDPVERCRGEYVPYEVSKEAWTKLKEAHVAELRLRRART